MVEGQYYVLTVQSYEQHYSIHQMLCWTSVESIKHLQFTLFQTCSVKYWSSCFELHRRLKNVHNQKKAHNIRSAWTKPDSWSSLKSPDAPYGQIKLQNAILYYGTKVVLLSHHDIYNLTVYAILLVGLHVFKFQLLQVQLIMFQPDCVTRVLPHHRWLLHFKNTSWLNIFLVKRDLQQEW